MRANNRWIVLHHLLLGSEVDAVAVFAVFTVEHFEQLHPSMCFVWPPFNPAVIGAHLWHDPISNTVESTERNTANPAAEAYNQRCVIRRDSGNPDGVKSRFADGNFHDVGLNSSPLREHAKKIEQPFQ